MQLGTCNRRVASATLAGIALSLLADGARAAETVEILIQDYTFTPALLTIKTGITVKWTNREKRTTHSVLFSGPGGFESERLFPGESWERRFETPGSYAYGCGPHPEMKGAIVVTD